MKKEKLVFKELDRFPTKVGRYLVTAVGKKSEKYCGGPTMFTLEPGDYTYLKDEKLVVRSDYHVMRISDFKAMLATYIKGCEKYLRYQYHEIVYTLK